MNDHAHYRELILGGDAADLDLHVADCADCAALADRVATVRRLAPSIAAGAPPADVADRVILALRAAPPVAGPSRRTRLARALVPRVAIAAAAAVVLVAVLVTPDRGTGPTVDLSDALLVSAKQTEAAGTARLQLQGVAEVGGGATPVRVIFGGVGELSDDRMHYRGLAKAGATMVPYELTTIGPDAWTRRPDGSWSQVHERVGALAPLVMDAGSVLELLRLPKDDLRLVRTDDDVVDVAFKVTVDPGLVYDVVATVGRDDLLRRVEIEASTAEWRTTATMTLYGFGEPVRILRPARSEVTGSWARPQAVPVGALFPFG